MSYRPFAFVISAVLLASLSACTTTPHVSAAQAGPGSDDALPLPFHAHGNEPGWSLLMNDAVAVDWGYGRHQVRMPRPMAEQRPDGIHYVAADDAHKLTFRITDEVCRDSMSGMPYPYAVTVRVDDTRLAGCGGRPRALLAGVEWVVEDVAGKGIIDASRMTLNFATDGQLSGRASCNRYHAHYKLSGETLEMGPVATTRMACAPALNNQEHRFVQVLRDVRGFDVDATGKLILYTPAGQTIEAYPSE